MATDKDDTRGSAGTASCSSCGAALSGDQRYCLQCGTRRGPLPPAIAAQLASLFRRDRGEEDLPTTDSAANPAARPGFMPTPRVAAIAVMGMLAFGVFLGSATSQLAQSAGLHSIVLQVAPSAPEEAEEATETASAAPAAAAESEPLLPATTSSVPATEEAPTEEAPAEETEEPVIQPETEEETLPPVKHVFLIVLGENGYEETFGASSTAPYLAKTLPEKGELLTNYYAVTKGDLANQIALLSGQGPTAETAANCPNYTDVVPGTLSLTGQVEGSGCVYPAATATLPGQLAEKKLKWKAYVEGLANGCAHEEGQRNPFVYFHSVIDTPECATGDVGLDQLAPDLKTAAKTPALSYIVPDACDAGGEGPCEDRSAQRPRRRRSVPAAGGAGDRSLSRLQGRRADRDHLSRGSPDRPDARHQLLLRLPGLREPASRSGARSRHRSGQTDRRRRPGRPAAALALRRPRDQERKRLLQPLLTALQHRGTVRT